MRIAPVLAGAALALTMAISATPSMAGPALPKLAPAGGYVVNVADWDGPRHGGRHGHHWRGENWRGHHGGPRVWNQCRAWRHECADRWPRLGWRYERCLARHGC